MAMFYFHIFKHQIVNGCEVSKPELWCRVAVPGSADMLNNQIS
jgi:hypothetical protein